MDPGDEGTGIAAFTAAEAMKGAIAGAHTKGRGPAERAGSTQLLITTGTQLGVQTHNHNDLPWTRRWIGRDGDQHGRTLAGITDNAGYKRTCHDWPKAELTTEQFRRFVDTEGFFDTEDLEVH